MNMKFNLKALPPLTNYFLRKQLSALNKKNSFLVVIMLLVFLNISLDAQTTITLPDCVDCPKPQGIVIGEVCPLMMDIKDWGRTANYNTISAAADLFITSDGQLWGYGNQATSAVLGFPAHVNDQGSATINMPHIEEITSPSPVAAVYRQGLTKTWKEVVLSPGNGGAYALADDGTLWAWGGDRTTSVTTGWDRAAHGGTLGSEPWNAWEIPAPTGVKFTQFWDHYGGSVFARGDDGKLYTWGRPLSPLSTGISSVAGVTLINTPTHADLIPHTILDDRYAVVPATGGQGLVYIDINGDTYTFGQGIHTTTPQNPPEQLMFPTPGVKAVKLTGTRGGSNPPMVALGDDQKLYWMTTGGTNGYPSSANRILYDMGPGSQPVNTWVKFDPQGAVNANYVDVAMTGGNEEGVAVADDGTVWFIAHTHPPYQITEAIGLDIVEAYIGLNGLVIMKASDGRSYQYAMTATAGSSAGNTPFGIGNTNIHGFDPEFPRGGPFLINCYVNPTGINNAVPPGN